MSSVLFSLPELYNSYKSWVSQNPKTLGDWESIAKWMSYFLAGRINNSQILSELIYCLSNLLVMFNDRIIKKANELHDYHQTTVDKMKLWLTVIEYSEVFCELSARKLWGTTGKWVIIICIQIFKCISRMLLIFHYKESIIQNPPIPVLDRKNLSISGDNCSSLITKPNFESITFTLKRSGRVVRKIDSSPPTIGRDWKPLPKPSFFQPDGNQSINSILAKRMLIAETIYVIKPIVHLASLACFGTKTWRPWVISLALDFTSLELYRSCTKKNAQSLTKQQRLQISKRTVLLLLYVLRSPMYDKHSKNRLHSFLMALSNVPLAGLVCKPLAEYLPFWQSTYFYMWST